MAICIITMSYLVILIIDPWITSTESTTNIKSTETGTNRFLNQIFNNKEIQSSNNHRDLASIHWNYAIKVEKTIVSDSIYSNKTEYFPFREGFTFAFKFKHRAFDPFTIDVRFINYTSGNKALLLPKY